MNRCDQCMENLSSYIDGELSIDQAEIIEAHLKECDSCANEHAVLKAIISACSELEEELPEGFETSLHKRLEKAKEEAQAKRNAVGKIRLYSQIAAGFVVIIAFGFVVRSGLFNASKLSGNAQARDMAAPRSATEAKAEEESMVLFNTAMKAMPSETPDSLEGDEAMKGIGRGFSDDLQDSSAETASETTGQLSVALAVPNYAGSYMIEGNDTVVRIKTEDIGKAYKSILTIDQKLHSSNEHEETVITGIGFTDMEFTEASINEPVELKLFYQDDDKWQEFLGEMQSVFPGMEVESAPAAEEQEYIRIFIVKE